MSVYIIIDEWHHLIGVYANEETANAEAAEINKERECVRVEAWEVIT